MKRLITEQQEKVIRLCHHDFEGLTQSEAAERMGISQQAVSKLLAKVEKVAPQLFPILTKFQARSYHHLMMDGWSVKDIAKHLETSSRSVYNALKACRDKGLSLPKSVCGNILRYEDYDTDWIDEHTVEKF